MKILYFLESIRTPWLDWIMSAITHIGSETVFMVLGIFVFWCVSKQCGYYLLSVGFLGNVINQFLKLLFRIPRPWVQDPDFTIVESARADATGYSFPSGHTQNVVGTFGGIARYTKRRWIRIVSIVILVLVSFSRMYLGVHTPLDVGVAFVSALVLVFLLYPLMEKIRRHPNLLPVLLAMIFLCSVGYVVFVSLYSFPADVDADNLLHGTENAWKLAGAAGGLLISAWIEQRYIRFETEAVWWVQIIKLAVGLGLLLGVKAGLKEPLIALFGNAGVAGAVRYALMVLLAGALWPMAFKPLRRLGEKKTPAAR